MSRSELAYVIAAFSVQLVLIAHFAVRKWALERAIKYGFVVYILGLVYAYLSASLVEGGAHWGFWVGGVIYLAWGVFGLVVEYGKGIQWRNPPRWPILIPYITLYLAMVMFYWLPLASIARWMWFAQGALFLVSTALNLASHGEPNQEAN